MKLSYDKTTDSLYIELRPAQAARLERAKSSRM